MDSTGSVLARVASDDKLFASVVADLARMNTVRGSGKAVDALADLIEVDPSLRDKLWAFRDTLFKAISV